MYPARLRGLRQGHLIGHVYLSVHWKKKGWHQLPLHYRPASFDTSRLPFEAS
jgi:hypothetical protein